MKTYLAMDSESVDSRLTADYPEVEEIMSIVGAVSFAFGLVHQREVIHSGYLWLA